MSTPFYTKVPSTCGFGCFGWGVCVCTQCQKEVEGQLYHPRKSRNTSSDVQLHPQSFELK